MTHSPQKVGLAYALTIHMKSITFTAVKNGKGYVTSRIVPANHSDTSRGSAWGFVIAGILALAAAGFVCMMLLGSH